MVKCMRCKCYLPPDALMLCDNCLIVVPEIIIELRDYYEIYLPFPTDLPKNSDAYWSRIHARQSIENLIQRIIDSTGESPEEMLYASIGDIEYLLSLSTNPDTVYMLQVQRDVLEEVGKEFEKYFRERTYPTDE